MNLKDFKVQSEAEDTLHLVHPNGKTFTVEKKGLSPKAMKAIQSLACGGSVQKMSTGGTAVPLMLDPNATDALPGPQPTPGDVAVDALSTAPEKAFPLPTQDEIYQRKLAERMATIPPGEAYENVRKNAPNLVLQDLENQQNAHRSAAQMQADDVVAQNAQRSRVGLAPIPVPSLPGSPPVAQSPLAQMPQRPEPINPFAQRGTEMEGMLNHQQGDVKNYMRELGGAGANQQAAYQDFINQQSQVQTPDQVMADYKQKDDAMMNHIMESQIDPNRYWHSKSTGSKILAGIGVLLSGLGGRSNNAAMDQINNAITADIDAQKNEQGKQMNLWKMNRERSKDEMQAHLMTQNQLLTGVQAKVAMAGAQTQNIEARFRGTELINQIEQQKAQNRFQLGLMGGGAGGNADPAQMVSSLVPKEHQAKVFEEVGRAQNIAKNSDRIMKLFDQASQENTVMRTGAGYFRKPGSVMALHQMLLPNFKQIDGTVRQGPMDETFNNVTPQPGDNSDKIAYRKQALRDWMHSETAAPTAKGFGIDLSQYQSTSSDPSMRMSPQLQQLLQVARAHPNDPSAQLFFKKYGVR